MAQMGNNPDSKKVYLFTEITELLKG